MEIIPVTPDVSVEFEDSKWRLVQDHDNGKTLQTLVEADASHLVFHPTFPDVHKLTAFDVPVSAVVRVVLGWTPEEHLWQLGLYLMNNADGMNNITWCKLSAWSASQTTAAKNAGEALSRVINSPFQIIDGDTDGVLKMRMNEATQPSMQTNLMMVHPIPVQALPIDMGDWTLRNAAQGIAWQLTRTWTVRHTTRILFFAVIFALFLFLGAGSLRSGLAPVAPDWLPIVAFGIALVLAYSMLENAWQLITKQQIVVDEENREIRCERVLTSLVSWRVPFDDIEFILISQEPARPQGRRSREEPMYIAQDTWVHVYAKGQFYVLSEIEDVEGKSWQWENVRRRAASDIRLPLDLTEYDTPLHHAVMQMADRIGVRAYVDIR